MPIEKLDRTVFKLTGEGVVAWLEGLTTNSLKKPISFNALLTPQGKIIADFFVAHDGNALLIDTADKFAIPLFKRLCMYRLRAPIDIEQTELNVYAVWNGHGDEGEIDPRNQALGRRLITEDFLIADGNYDAHRLKLGVVDSAYDFETATTFPANANMDILNGVDFKKGCFVGQEVVSRMKRMTTVKKRMQAFTLPQGQKVAIGDKIMAEQRVIGDVLYVSGAAGMAMIRLDRLAAADVPLSLNAADIQLIAPTEATV